MTDYELTAELLFIECPLEISSHVLGVTSDLCRDGYIVNIFFLTMSWSFDKECT